MVSDERDRGDVCASYVLVLSCRISFYFFRYTSIGSVLTILNETIARFCFLCQPWTDNGPDGRHGRCVGATVRTRGGDRATNRHPATVDDLAKAEISTWRIAPAACATVSQRLTFLCLDCAFCLLRSFCVS